MVEVMQKLQREGFDVEPQTKGKATKSAPYSQYHRFKGTLDSVAEIQLFEWRGKSHQFSESGEVLLLDVFC